VIFSLNKRAFRSSSDSVFLVVAAAGGVLGDAAWTEGGAMVMTIAAVTTSGETRSTSWVNVCRLETMFVAVFVSGV